MKPAEFLNELSNKKLGDYKTAAGADATAADKAGDYKRGDKRMSGIIKATKKEFANDEKKKVAEGYGRNSYAYRQDGGANDERHDLDPSDWYIVKDGKMYKTSVYPNQEQEATARGYSRTRDEAKAKADKQGMSEDLDENLHQWFKEKWVRFGPDGKIRGDCARGDDSEGKPKCLPQSKAQNLGKEGRASAASRKRREDPNPERSGKAINVNTKKKSNEGAAEGLEGKVVFSGTGANGGKYEIIRHGDDFIIRANGKHIDSYGSLQRAMGVLKNEVPGLKQGVAEEKLDELSCWSGYHRVDGTKAGFPGSCAKNKTNEELDIEEDRENFNGINLLLQKDDEEVFVKASAGSRELGHVLFVMDGDYLMPQDLEVEEKYRGQGIAQTMYDFVKSKGYKIRRSGQQTDAGAGFWAKHRPEQNVWEEQHSESCPHCGGEMVSEELMNEKKDACYYKVKSRYKVWPSAYASGALVKCRKSGADSWGNGSKKNESSIMQGLNQLDEGWKEKLGAAALAGSMALGAGGAHARVTPDGQGGFTGGLKPSATVTAPSDSKPAAEAPKGFSKEYLQKAADPNRTGRYMISVEKAQELLKQGQGQ